MMIHKHLGSFRKSYFIKRRINLTPKSRSPGIIQCFNVMMIFSRKNPGKPVRLSDYNQIVRPAHYRAASRLFWNHFHNAELTSLSFISQFSINGRSKRSMLTCSVIKHGTIFIFNQNFRVFTAQPYRWSCRRSTHNDFQIIFGSQSHRFIQPGKSYFPLPVPIAPKQIPRNG